MLAAHEILAFLVVGVPAVAALVGGLVYWRRRGAGRLLANLLALAQSLALGAILAPWIYAPAQGPRRLLWFAGTSLLAAALAVRAFMTGAS